MIIRTMLPDDYLAVYDLWSSTKGMGLNSEDDSKEGIIKYLKRNPTTCFVAIHDNIPIGAILAGHDGRRGYLYHTAVKETFRSQGIGSTLLRSALDALENEGITKVALVVFQQNHDGNLFWEKAGFSVRDDLIYRNLSLKNTMRIDT